MRMLGLLGLLLSLAGPAAAGAPGGLATAVAAFVAVALDAPLPPLPEIVHAAPERMQALRHGHAAPPATLDVVALYDDEARTILLPEGWAGGSPAEMSVLVHEMVHHLQNVSGRRYACPAEREAEAYSVQERWLALFGETLEGAFAIDPMTRLLLTRCGI
jgi:hypothetical protein